MARVTIIFEAHGTTLDNEAGVASGHADVWLSILGRRQAAELGERRRTEDVAAVFCSDLRRSWETAELAFGERGVPIVRDPRLRECDYGDLTRRPVEVIEREKPRRLREPFPNGESYEQATGRVKAFLDDFPGAYAGRPVLVVGHRATQYGLERWLAGVPLARAVTAPWTWQPGWTYEARVTPSGAATFAGR